MDKSREEFEQKFPIPAHWIEFDEKQNKYYCPYVADAKASEYQEMWGVWQSRQAEVDQLKEAMERQGKLAIQAMNEAHKGSRLELSIAKDIQASLKPELIESERQMNVQLTDENMKLEARVDLLQKVICLHLDDRFLNVDWALGDKNANS